MNTNSLCQDMVMMNKLAVQDGRGLRRMGFEACGGRSGLQPAWFGLHALYLIYICKSCKGIHLQRLGLLLTFIIIGMNDGLNGMRRGGGETAGQTNEAPRNNSFSKITSSKQCGKINIALDLFKCGVLCTNLVTETVFRSTSVSVLQVPFEIWIN